MSEFKNKSITTQGMELLSKALSGEKLQFTRIEMGAGKFEGDIGSVESLVEVKQNLPITQITRKGSQVTLGAVLKIEDVTSDYHWTECGVYAKGVDDKEVLYFYAYTTNSSFISRDSLSEKLIHVTVMVSNAADITAVIDSSLVYLTAEALEHHTNDKVAHGDIRESVEEIKEQISTLDVSWEGIIGKPETFEPSPHTHDLSSINQHTSVTVTNAQNTLLNAMSSIDVSPIKSIQRGIVKIGPTYNYATINFSEVNLSKSTILLDGAIFCKAGGTDTENSIGVYASAMTSTTATLSMSKPSGYLEGSTIGWQIIEYR